MRLHRHERILTQDERGGKMPTAEAVTTPEVGCL